jgi:hypothetical protein
MSGVALQDWNEKADRGWRETATSAAPIPRKSSWRSQPGSKGRSTSTQQPREAARRLMKLSDICASHEVAQNRAKRASWAAATAAIPPEKARTVTAASLIFDRGAMGRRERRNRSARVYSRHPIRFCRRGAIHRQAGRHGSCDVICFDRIDCVEPQGSADQRRSATRMTKCGPRSISMSKPGRSRPATSRSGEHSSEEALTCTRIAA